MSSIIEQHRTVNESPEKTSSSPVAVVDGNEDLLTEILRRLPAKSLLRFRSVSKRWLSIISSPYFTLLWTTSKSKSLSGLLLRRLSNSGIPKFEYIPLLDHHHHQPFTSLDFVDHQPEGVNILQSCNGLLLCSGFRLRHHSCNYYVYNPTTMKFTALPRPFGHKNRIVRGVSLAFDSSKSAHYKVICVSSHSSLLRGIYWVQIYSSKTRRWKPYDDLVLGPFDMVFDKGFFCNGSIHWLSRVSDTSLCFDVDEQWHKTIPMPPLGKGEKERTCGYFGGSRDHLHLVLSSGSGTALLDVFEMALDYSKWSIKCRVDLEFVLTPFLEMQLDFSVPLDYCKFSLLCLFCGEVEDELAMVIYIAGKAIRYNVKDKSIKKLYDVKMQNKDEYVSPNCRWVIGHPYFESLISV